MLTRLAQLLPLQIAQLVAGFGAVWAFTRLLDPADYGAYALVYSAAMLAHTLTLTWAEAAAFRFHLSTRATGRYADHIATLLAIAGFAAFVVAGIVWFSMRMLGMESGALISFAAGFVFFRFLTRIAREGERADGRLLKLSVAESLYQLGGFGAGAALIAWTNLGPAAPFAGMTLAGLLVALFDGPSLYRAADKGRATKTRALTYASYGWPLAIALSLDLGLQTAGRALIAMHDGAAGAGAFAAAFGLARTLDILFLWSAAALGPHLLRAYEAHGANGAREAAKEGVAILGALSIPAAIGLILVAKPLTTIMVGPELRDQTAALMPWMIFAAFASGWATHYFSEAFQLARRSGLRAMLMLAPAIMFVALAVPGVIWFGAEGVAMSTAVAATCGVCVLAVAGRRFVALPTAYRDICKSLVAAAAMTAGVLAAPEYGGWPELLSKAAIGAAIYGAAALALDIAGVRSRWLLDRAEAAP